MNSQCVMMILFYLLFCFSESKFGDLNFLTEIYQPDYAGGTALTCGRALKLIHDVDGDGIRDLLIGCHGVGPGVSSGTIFIISMNLDGTASGNVRKIDQDIVGDIQNYDNFGTSAEYYGGVNNRTVVVAGHYHGHPDANIGKIWMLDINEDSVDVLNTVTEGDSDFSFTLSPYAGFGSGLGAVDLNLDGIKELLVGASFIQNAQGIVFSFDVNPSDMSINDFVEITHSPSNPKDCFGSTINIFDDLDNDGIPEIIIGSSYNEYEGITPDGSFYVVFLNAAGDVTNSVHIGNGLNGFDGEITENDFFGLRIEVITDIDGDGIREVYVGGTVRFFMIFFNTDGTVRKNILLDFKGELIHDLAILDRYDGKGSNYVAFGRGGITYASQFRSCEDFSQFLRIDVEPLTTVPKLGIVTKMTELTELNEASICVFNTPSKKRQGQDELYIFIDPQDLPEGLDSSITDIGQSLTTQTLNETLSSLSIEVLSHESFELIFIEPPTIVFPKLPWPEPEPEPKNDIIGIIIVVVIIVIAIIIGTVFLAKHVIQKDLV